MRVIQKQVLRKWQEIAAKYNVSIDDIREVETSIWNYVKSEMAKGIKGQYNTFKNIYLRYFGTFYVRSDRFDYINKKRK